MTQLNRSIERWKGCDPAYMATEQSPAAITYAFIDAQHDILALADALHHCVDWLNAAGIAETMPVQQQARAALGIK